MANVRDSDTSLWLHNKLGTSNDSWISGSICSQLNKEVLHNVKDCFLDLQTQVKLKLLLSFFHIPRRLVEEWRGELEEIIEVAGADSELWVSMIAETMKTFPAFGRLNTEISEYEETRPIFTDMVADLRKAVSKHFDFGMLPLECQYLNKNALTSVVGQQPPSTKHFTLKRKPKSATLRSELLQKSADAQSSLKKSSAPTIPLRSRGMPRKMTDTTPLKGIPSRVPTSGFRSPTTNQSQSRPNISRTPAGRKDGGIKLIEFTEQPLGYAATKKRKRQQELEEQQKKATEQRPSIQQQSSVEDTLSSTVTPDYAAGLTSTIYTQTTSSISSTVKEEVVARKSSKATAAIDPDTAGSIKPSSPVPSKGIENSAGTNVVKRKEEPDASLQSCPASVSINQSVTTLAQNCSSQLNGSVFIMKQSSSLPSDKLPASHEGIIASLDTQQTKPRDSFVKISESRSNPIILSQTIIKPAKVKCDQSIINKSTGLEPAQSVGMQLPHLLPQKTVVTSNLSFIPSLTSFSETSTIPTIVHTQNTPTQLNQASKIVFKTPQAIPVVMTKTTLAANNPPPLIATQQPPFLNVNLPNRPVTIQPASQAAQAQHIQTQLQLQQQQFNSNQVQTRTVNNAHTVQSPKFAQVVMSPGMNVKGKTIILAQKGVVLRSMGGDVYQQIPINNVSGLGNLGNTAIVATSPKIAAQTTAQNNVKSINSTQLPALISPSNLSQNINVPVVIASHNISQPQTMQTIIGSSPQQTVIRPVLATNLQGGLLSPSLTLIQRPGQHPQLVQVQSSSQVNQQQPPMQRAIISHSQTQLPLNSQRIIIQQSDRQAVFSGQQHQQTQGQIPSLQQQPQRKGLSLSNEHVIKAHEMFRKANRVNRPDKALILGFMAGLRENPRPNPENVIVIKLGETEEHVKQEDNTSALMLVESLIRLDYNTGEWKTFQNYRRLDPQSQVIHLSDQEPNIKQSKNSVVI